MWGSIKSRSTCWQRISRTEVMCGRRFIRWRRGVVIGGREGRRIIIVMRVLWVVVILIIILVRTMPQAPFNSCLPWPTPPHQTSNRSTTMTRTPLVPSLYNTPSPTYCNPASSSKPGTTLNSNPNSTKSSTYYRKIKKKCTNCNKYKRSSQIGTGLGLGMQIGRRRGNC